MSIRALILVTSVAMLVAMLGQSASAADDPPPTDNTITFGTSTVVEGSLTLNTQTYDVTSSTVASTNAGSQCTGIGRAIGSIYCLGSQNADDYVQVLSTTNPDAVSVKWIRDEAVDFLSALYDVPNDGRISSYALPEIRAYMANRLLSIVTKEAYGQPLTDNEKMSLKWLNQRLYNQQLALAKAALAEWTSYNASNCSYTPPRPPDWVTDVRQLPATVTNYCRAHPGTRVYMLPPMPSADDFRTWGMYRAAGSTGLQYADPATSITPAEMSAYIGMAGTAGAIAAGFGAYGIARLSTAVAQFGVDALGLGLQVVHAASWEIPYAWVELSAVSAGAVGLAGLVVGIITALLNIALFSWQFAENMKVGPELTEAEAVASRNTDPLGLEALKAQNAGKTPPDGSTPYLDNGLPLQLLAMMKSVVGGSTPDTLWAGSAHTDQDLRFGQAGQTVDQISVPKPDGSRSTVWLSKRWMIEQTHDTNGNVNGPPRAEVSLQYLNPQGKVDIAYRAWNPQTGRDEFQIATIDRSNDVEMTSRLGPMDYTLPDGTRVQTVVEPKAAPDLGGPRPAAAGRMVVGTPINLRPNPVDEAGNFVGLNGFVDGYTYTWTVQRSTGTAWVNVPFDSRAQGTSATYGAFFVPSQAGDYRAVVSMKQDDSGDSKQGTVIFKVAQPVLTSASAQLVDTGSNDVRVALQSSMNTPLEHRVKIDVQWPGDLADPDAPRPTTSVTVTCHNVDPFNCSTADSLTAEFGDALKHTLTSTSRLRDGVTVTVTDLDGAAVWTQDLRFDSTLRPSFAAPPAAPTDQLGLLQFDPYQSYLSLPVGVDGNNPNHKIATIVPGSAGASTVSIVNPNTWGSTPVAVDLFPGTDRAGRYLASVVKEGGDWVLELYARTRLEDVGTYTVPLTIQQDDGKRATLYLTINPVIAPDQLYRGAVVSDVDPDDFGVTKLPTMSVGVTGGDSTWDAYDGQICLSLSGEDGTRQKCGPVTQMVGDQDNPVPFPYAELFPHGISGGTHTAAAWLPASSQTWDVPISSTFILASDPPDVAGLGWDGHTLRAAVTPGRTRSTEQPVPISAVTCTLDGTVLDPCFGQDGGELTPAGLSPGTHQLRVAVADQADNYDIENYSFEAGLKSITVAPAKGTVRVGRTLALTATGHYSDGVNRSLTRKAAWTSSNPAVAKVNPTTGAVTGVKAGTAKITATSGDFVGAATVTVKPALATMPASWVKKWPTKTGPVKKAKVGKQLKVTKPVLSAAGKKQHLAVSYRWYAAGKAVGGATNPSLKVTKAMKGKKITLVVTVSKSGYRPLSKTLAFGKAR